MAFLGLPSLVFNGGLAAYAIIAFAMIAITIFVLGQVLPRRGEPPLLTQLTLALAILAGGSVLVLSLLFVFLNPDGTAAWTWVLLAFNFMMMGPAGIWFIGLIAFRDRRVAPTGWLWPAVLALVVGGSEVLMGVLFALANSTANAVSWPIFASGLSSVWFLWSMAAVMGALLLWAPIGRVERWVLVALTGSAIVAPWVTAYPTVGGAATAVLMAGVFVAILREISRPGLVSSEEVPVLLGLGAAFVLMASTGGAVAATGGSLDATLAFGGAMGLVMSVEIAYLFRRFYQGTFRTPWVLRAPDDDLPGRSAPEGSIEVPGAPIHPQRGASPPAVPSPPTGP